MGPREIALTVLVVFAALVILVYFSARFAVFMSAIRQLLIWIGEKIFSRKEE